jgi:hypothetical protein
MVSIEVGPQLNTDCENNTHQVVVSTSFNENIPEVYNTCCDGGARHEQAGLEWGSQF